MPYPHDIKAAGTGVDDDDIVLTTDRVSDCNEHIIRVTAGTVDVEIAIDERLVEPPTDPSFTDSGTFPIAVMLLNATNPSVWVTEIAEGEAAVLTGRFDRVRLRQKGSTAAAAHISSYRR